MPNGPRREPLVTRETEHDVHLTQDRYTLRTDAGTKIFSHGAEPTPMVKFGAEVHVNHDRNQDAYAYRGEGGDHRNLEHSGSGWMQMRQAATADLMEGAGRTPKLFGHAHEEGRSSVEFMESTKAARVHAPMLLALAQQDTAVRYPNRTLGASDDRSDYSEKLVGHLQNKLGKQFEQRRTSNPMEFVPEFGDDSQAREHIERVSAPRIGGNFRTEQYLVPQGQISSARQTVRNTIRPPKPTRAAPGPKQPKLPFG